MVGWLTNSGDADTYLADKIGADAWAAIPSVVKNQYLVSAYRELNSDPRFVWLVDPSDAMKSAQIEWAWSLYSTPGAGKRRSNRSQGVTQFTIGNFSETYSATTNSRFNSSNGFGYGPIVDNYITAYFKPPTYIGIIKRDDRLPEGMEVPDVI